MHNFQLYLHLVSRTLTLESITQFLTLTYFHLYKFHIQGIYCINLDISYLCNTLIEFMPQKGITTQPIAVELLYPKLLMTADLWIILLNNCSAALRIDRTKAHKAVTINKRDKGWRGRGQRVEGGAKNISRVLFSLLIAKSERDVKARHKQQSFYYY